MHINIFLSEALKQNEDYIMVARLNRGKIMTEHKEASDMGSLCSSKAVFTFQKGAQKESEPVARKGLKLLRVACAGQVLFFL